MLMPARPLTNKKYKFSKRRNGDPPKLLSKSILAKNKINWIAKFSDIEHIISSMWKIYKE